MRKTTTFLTLLSALFLPFVATAQNILDNLQLKEQVEIYFESGKHAVGGEAIQKLQKAADLYQNNKAIKVRITAHTDGQGNTQSNYILADKRANAVKYFLMSKGVPPDALVASTFGQDKPKADNDTEEGRKSNRRATVEIYEPALEKVKIVEKEKQVIVEKPVVVEKQVIVEKPVVVEKQVIVEKPVVVEKPFLLKATAETASEATTPVLESKKVEEKSPYLQGVVKNSETNEPVKALIFVTYMNGRVDSLYTDDKGAYRLLCVFDEQVTMDVFAKGYFYASQDVVIKPSMAQKIDLQPVQIGNIATITNLYFVGDQATLLKTSDKELAKILRFMRLNQGITVEIAGHVNAPGVLPERLPKGEFALSTNRAITIKKFLIDNGFAEEKIKAKGYGNSKMKFPEPENERQEELNRRVEIKILDSYVGK